jgi:hypothetical protein
MSFLTRQKPLPVAVLSDVCRLLLDGWDKGYFVTKRKYLELQYSGAL